MSTNNIKTDSKIKVNPNCAFCQGSGFAQYIDISQMIKAGEGTFTLGYLADKFGGIDFCPECLPNSFTKN